jgi:hypothetical protein
VCVLTRLFPQCSRRQVRAANVLIAILALTGLPGRARSQQVGERELTTWRQRDRGAGQPTSMFGTYIRPGEWLLYPFVERYKDKNLEYSPDEFGHGLDADYRGTYYATEALIFLAYGLTSRLAVEFEAAVISAEMGKAPDDPSTMPSEIEESGLGDVEGQLRYRWNNETDRAPEVFSYFETVFPLQKNRQLIGTQDWEFKLGSGVVRGFSWGTTTIRAAVEYDAADQNVALGEVAVEYLKRLNSSFRVYAGVEGVQDEIEGIFEVQWFLRPDVFLKFNNAFGLTSKATDYAPEFGLMFSFR